MKVKVINRKSLFYGREFVVDYLKYDLVASKKENIIVDFEDVVFLKMTDMEKKILENRDILKIQCPKVFDGTFYQILIDALNSYLGSEFKTIDVVVDQYNELKRVWEKKITAVVDGRALRINIIGQYYGKNVDIKIEEVDKEVFLKECLEKKRQMKMEILKRQKQIDLIEGAISNLVN